MANILKKLRRLRTKQGRFPDDGRNSIGLVELLNLPPNTFLTCPKCGTAWFHISREAEGGGCRVGCVRCAWESAIDFPILDQDFSGECPKCNSPQFAIMKLHPTIAVGCRKCSWYKEKELQNYSTMGLIIPP